MAEGLAVKGKGIDSLSSGSDILFDFYCEVCKDDKNNVEAEGFCVDCGEYLCKSCYKAHSKTRQTRHHELLDKDKMPKDTPLSPDRTSKDISTKCDHHAGRPVECYCKTHDVFGCSMCLLKDHRGCHDIELIIEKSENILDSQEYKDFIKTLESLNQQSKDVIAKARSNISLTNTCYADVIKSVKKLRSDVNTTLDQLEQDITVLANTLRSEEEQKMTALSNECSTITKSIESMLADQHNLQSSRRVCQVYISMKEGAKHTQTLQDNVNRASSALIVKKFWFKPNSKLQEFVDRPYALGEISNEAESVRERKQAKTNQPSLVTTLCIAEIDVRLRMERSTPRIKGSAVVSSNRLIVVDYVNKEVKLFDTGTNSNKLMGVLQPMPLDFSIAFMVLSKTSYCDVTALDSGQAAVTVPGERHIVILNVSDTLATDRRISVSGKCHGVAYSKKRLIVTYINPPKLEIMDLSGNVIKKLQNDSDGEQLFHEPKYVCVSNDGETLYVSDCDRNSVISLTFDGKVKSVYSDSDLVSPMKVCVDHRDNVYVCGGGRNILMLTADLTKIQIILTQADGLDSNVLSVSHCQETNRLYVGMKANNQLKVFQLS